MSATIGLFYGSTDGAGATAGELIKTTIEKTGLATVELHDVAYTDLKEMERYSYLILGVSTWNIGLLQDDWEYKFDQLDDIDLTGKLVALYGMGDQYGYPDSYVDAMETLGAKVMERGGEPAGFWLVDDSYEFEYSKAVIDGVFVGLALDDDNQSHLTEERVQMWVEIVLEDFGLMVPVPA
ncbi:MAG: flavodoxin [Caldilineaceae bacterium]|nr:flavodoxin [Caldilineaceae bacterium]